MKDPSENNVVLRGVDTSDIDVMALNQPGIPQVIDRLVSGGNQGFNSTVIRLVVPPDRWNSNPDNFFNAYLKPAVDHCVQKDVYCIIDYHSFGENYNYNTPGTDQQLRSFWSYVAPKFKDVPNVIYELFNEPVNPQDWNTWKQVAQPWVDLIRAAAPQTVIIVGSPAFSSFTKYAPGSPFNGGNLMYAMHLYPGCGYDNPNTWEDRFGAAAKSVPVFMTEFGWDGNGDAASIQNCYNGTTSGFGQNIRNYLDNVHPNISWSVWNYGYMPGMIDSNYNVLGGDTNEGQFIQQWLSDKKNSDQPIASSSSGASGGGSGSSGGSDAGSEGSGGSGGNSVQSLYIDASATSNFVDTNGNNWVADEYFDGGNTADRGNITVQGDPTGKVDQTERYGMNGYHIPIANGTYKVTLDFAETYNGITGAGQRVFDANVEGTAISNIDPFGDTGGRNIADRKQVTVTVTNGKLDITFTPHVQEPEINAIEISPQ